MVNGRVGALLELAGEKAQPVKPAAEEPLDESWAEPVVFDGTAVAFSSEKADKVNLKDNGIEVTNRAKRNLGELVEDYSVQDDLDGLIVEFDGATLSALRDRAAIYGGRIEATKVPGVGFTLSAIFPNLKSLAIQEIK